MLRLIAFGILWFFVTLSVESSIIPIPMIICEYRVYLPFCRGLPGHNYRSVYIDGKVRDKKTRLYHSFIFPDCDNFCVFLCGLCTQ